MSAGHPARATTGVSNMGNKQPVESGDTGLCRPSRMHAKMALRDRLARLATIVLLGCALELGLLSPSALGSGPAGPRSAMVIALDGAIGPATADYVDRALQAAERQGAVLAILRLDTPGGLDSAMRDIIRVMLASPVPVVTYVAPSGARAASAGTYILYASALAAMAPGTNLGAATPVSMIGETPLPGSSNPSSGDPHMTDRPATAAAPPANAMAAKIANDEAAYIRGLATMHGRNADWAERAVWEAVSLPYDAALAERVIEVVAASIPDLLAQADGRTVVAQGKPMRLETKGLDIIAVEPAWRDRLLGILTDPNIVYLLLLAGIFGIILELSHPGLIAPGVLGTICLLVGGYGLNLLSVDYAGVALALLGIGLMIAEAFVPAFGALGLGGASALAIGSVMMFHDPGFRPFLPLVIGAALVGATFFGVVVTTLIRARRRPVTSGNVALAGVAGRTTRWTGTEGEVLVEGEHWRARAAEPLGPGVAVKVIARQGLTLWVAPM
jgi:membrane-bound serine protease (ClpP class)